MSPIELRLQRRFGHPAADFAAGYCECRYIVHVQRRQFVENALVQMVVRDEGLEGLGRGGEAAGHRHPQPGQVADHLAERGILAADTGEVG